jgi:hypothetical protein
VLDTEGGAVYYEVARQLVLTAPAGGTVHQHSQPVAAEGAAYVIIEATAYCAGGAGTPGLSVTLQESNDLENWVDGMGLSFAPPLPAFDRSAVSSIPTASNYYRLKYELEETGTASSTTIMVAAAINIVPAT